MAHHSDGEWFAVIGAIIVKWGAVEKIVYTSIHQIEREAAIAAGIAPVYSDLRDRRAFRDFTARKGRLRKLLEQHGKGNELARLDVIYRALVEPGKVRHALGHENTAIQPMTGELAIIRHGNPASGEQSLTTWKTFEELVSTVRTIDGAWRDLAQLLMDITLRVDAAGKDQT
jgi:hypothetical protein